MLTGIRPCLISEPSRAEPEQGDHVQRVDGVADEQAFAPAHHLHAEAEIAGKPAIS